MSPSEPDRAGGKTSAPGTSALSAASVSATDHWITLPDRGRYHYVTAGKADKPLLAFFHGLADSWRSIAPLIPYLTDDFQIVALDQRGHGETGDRFASYAPADFAGDAETFIATLDRQPAALVGHSMGSMVVQRVAAERPQAARSLVLIGGTDTCAGNPVLKELASEIANLPDPVPVNFIASFQASTVHDPLPAGFLDAFVADSVKLTRRVWQETVGGLMEDSLIVGPQIKAPTLILWGEHDSVFDSTTQKRLRASLGDAVFIGYAEVGHAPHWERPEIVARAIRQFVDQR